VTGRIPPHDLDAESAVLAASLLSETDLTQAAAVVRAEDFYSPANRRIWEACLDLTSTRQPVDSITVAAWLKGKAHMAEIGGVPYLARVVDATPAVANVAAHAEIVKRLARQRAMIAAGQRIAAEGYGDVGDVQQWLDGCEHSIFGISRNGAETQTCQTVEAVIRSVFEGIRKAGENGGLAGLSTAFTDLDELTTGMHPGELWVFAGRPGMGKTSFAMSVATGVAIGSQGEVGVLVFSLEMPREQLVMRMLAAESGVPLTAIRQGNLSQPQWSIVAEKSRELSGTTLVIDDKPGANVLYLRAVARRIEAEYARETARDGRPRKLGLIVVDYLQLMRPVTPSGSREQDVSEISKSLKEIAKELRVPIIALAQLNRAVETRSTKDKRPQLSDLRESGAIEQDADIVLFLYRDEYYFREASKAPGLCELIIAKQRNGATQSVFTRFHGPTTAFASAPRETWPQGAEQ